MFALNKGEICSCPSRALLQKGLTAADFLHDAVARVKRIVVGDPLDTATEMGPQNSLDQLEKIGVYLTLGPQEGAKVLTGGAPAEMSGDLAGGYFIGLPVDVLHAFDQDGATMRVGLLSVRSMVDAKGAELTHAETVTLLNDLCCLAPGALLSPGITWEPVDNHTAAAYFTLGTTTVTAELRFDDSGDLVDFVADGRGAISADGRTITPLRWSTPLRDYAQVGPARVATKAEVNWHPDSGAWTFGKFALTSLAYNVVNRGRPADQEAHRPMIGHRSETR